MKKLLLALLITTITASSFGMFQQQMIRPYEQDKSVGGLMVLAGLGCVGASMWYANRVDYNQPIKIKNIGGSVSNSNTGGVSNTFYSINLPPRTIGAIAPLIPAVFCFWYGFKNLNS